LVALTAACDSGSEAPVHENLGERVDVVAGIFARYVITDGDRPRELATGSYFVAMLSASCDPCQESTSHLNELCLLDEIPPVVGLMMGDEEEIQQFRTLTDPQFPVLGIDTLEFFNLIGDAPPRFYIIQDGHPVRHLDAEEPTLEELLEFAMQ
jgi:hypothetical protein